MSEQQHEPSEAYYEGTRWCVKCGLNWPCPKAREALAGSKQPDQEQTDG